jgi:FkbM family methyltransferase
MNLSARKPLEQYLTHDMAVETWDGFTFIARAGTLDLYAIAVSEIFELENWFKPLAKGVVIDVGAYIGTYTVRAMRTADLVVAIEPLPPNFKALQKNVRLNSHIQRGKVVLVNKAVAEAKKSQQIFVPVESGLYRAESARLKPPRENYYSYMISADTLDGILSELSVEEVDLLKIDTEGYVSESLLGMLSTLRKTRWLFIELWKRDMPVVKALRDLGFRLKDHHGDNFLFKNEGL